MSRTSHRARLAALAAGAAALLACTGAAQAATTPPGYHPDQDHAGAGVAAHSGAAEPQQLAAPSATTLAQTGVKGLDVSSYQPNINWSTVAANGAKFAYVKATESTDYRNPQFSSQYTGSYNAGLIHGAYHFATPNTASGAAQANYFVDHGGGWSKDGKTLPGALDIEYNPYGAECYGLSASAMVSWIRDFSDTYHARTGRYPVIYSTTDWWSTCTGNSPAFASTSPLWIARYASSVGTLPAGWSYQTIWQYADSGTFPGDQDVFNGSADRLVALANG